MWQRLKALVAGWFSAPPRVRRMSGDWMIRLTTGRHDHNIADVHMHACEVDRGNSFYKN